MIDLSLIADTAELREALERMGLGLSGEQLDLIIAAIDTDEDLDLSYEELCGKNVDFVLKCLDFVLKCLGFVLKMFDFVLKMLNFAAAVGMTETEETYAEAKIAAAQRRKVCFQWKNPDFLLRSPDFLIRNSDFLLKSVEFVIKQLQERKERKKERVLTTAEKDAHLKVRAINRCCCFVYTCRRLINLFACRYALTPACKRRG